MKVGELKAELAHNDVNRRQNQQDQDIPHQQLPTKA
jgi:hypothetical protein